MSAVQCRPVVLGVDDSRGGQLALRWATDEADRRGLPVRVITAFEQRMTAKLSGLFTSSVSTLLDIGETRWHVQDITGESTWPRSSCSSRPRQEWS